MQQLEKKLREGTDQNQTSLPSVRGKWNTVNNPHEERYQSKLQDIQKERRAAIEVSWAFLTFLTCAIKIRNNTSVSRDPNGPIKRPVEQCFRNWGVTLETVIQVVDVRLCLYNTCKNVNVHLLMCPDCFPSTHTCLETVGRL